MCVRQKGSCESPVFTRIRWFNVNSPKTIDHVVYSKPLKTYLSQGPIMTYFDYNFPGTIIKVPYKIWNELNYISEKLECTKRLTKHRQYISFSQIQMLPFL